MLVSGSSKKKSNSRLKRIATLKAKIARLEKKKKLAELEAKLKEKLSRLKG